MPKVSYGRLIRVGLVGPKPRGLTVGDGQLVNIPAPPAFRLSFGGTQEGRLSVPIGHGASPILGRADRQIRRSVKLRKGVSSGATRSNSVEPILSRKAVVAEE